MGSRGGNGEAGKSSLLLYCMCLKKCILCKNPRERRPSEWEGLLSLTTLLYSVGEIILSQNMTLNQTEALGKESINQSIN